MNRRGITFFSVVVVILILGLGAMGLLSFYRRSSTVVENPTRTLASGHGRCEPANYTSLPGALAPFKKTFERWTPNSPAGASLPINEIGAAELALRQVLGLPTQLTIPQAPSWDLQVYSVHLEDWNRYESVSYPSGSAIIKGGLLVNHRGWIRNPGAFVSIVQNSVIILQNNGSQIQFPAPSNAGFIIHFIWPCGEGEDRIVSILAEPAQINVPAPENRIEVRIDGKLWPSDLRFEPCISETSNATRIGSAPLCVHGTFHQENKKEVHRFHEMTLTNQFGSKRLASAIDEFPLIDLR